MAEPNPQPEAEAAVSAPPPKGGGIMGPIIAAIIIVAGIAGVFKLLVVPALRPPGTQTPDELKGGADADEKGAHDDSAHDDGEPIKVPFELGESILVNIKGENNKVLSAKVGFLLRTKIKGKEPSEQIKTLETHLDKFKSMLVAATRGYFVELTEGDLESPEQVHRQQLKIKLKSTFLKVRSYDQKLIELLKDDPVEEVYLPYFTHQ